MGVEDCEEEEEEEEKKESDGGSLAHNAVEVVSGMGDADSERGLEERRAAADGR